MAIKHGPAEAYKGRGPGLARPRSMNYTMARHRTSYDAARQDSLGRDILLVVT